MQLFQKILCPIDFSEFSTLALRYAAALAQENEAELLIYHSIPDLTQAVSYLEGNYMETVQDLLAGNAAARLEESIKGTIPEGIKSRRRLGTENPAKGILDTAKEEGIDLIVMGTHGHTGPERFFVGSVTNKVLHKSIVPVLVVCKPSHHFIHDGKEPKIEIRRILCPVDLEPNTPRIRDLALSIGRLYQSQILFLYVAPKSGTVDLEEQRKRSQTYLLELVQPEREDWCTIEFLFETGDPAEEILRLIGLHEIDLVVMGHHTRRPIEELFLGSVAKRVVVDSQCPVMVVRSRSAIYP